MRILKAKRFEDEAEPLPEKDWLAPGSAASKYIKDMDDLTITLADYSEKQLAVFVNNVLLCVTADDEARNVKELIERLYRERIIYRERALAGES
jgi:hypothetical protein